MSLLNLTIPQAHAGLLKKDFSSVELTEAALARVRKRNKEVRAFLELAEQSALAQARKVDKKIQNREKIGVLSGLPMAVKEVMLIKGMRCSAGSRILANYIAPYDATVIKKLKRQDAVMIGTTNLDEFAMGSSTENSSFYPTRNPRDLSRVPGGSSGGSAAAVADGQCLYALGTDTGGSIRQPASFCGVVGLKPTYGRVSRYGLIAFASSLDQIGPLAKDATDAALVFDAIKGQDKRDATSVAKEDVPAEVVVKDLKIGVPKEYFIAGLDAGVETVVRQAIKRYEDLGAKVVEVSLPHSEYALPCYYIVAPAEASANLARFDGIKYGLSEKGSDLLAGYLETRQRGFGAEVRRRIIIGTYVLSAGYYDAYYLKAQKVRALIKQDFAKAFDKADVIMGPVAPTTAFKIGEKSDDPIAMYLSDIYTVSVNLAGLPAISVPCGEASGPPVGEAGLPVGLQIIGRPLDDEKILKVAQIYERERN